MNTAAAIAGDGEPLRWVRLPEQRPETWPWNGMQEDALVAIFLPGQAAVDRESLCEIWLPSGLLGCRDRIYVTPWPAFAAAANLPGEER